MPALREGRALANVVTDRVRHLLTSPALFAVVLVFYAYTLAPSLNWADSARVQLDVVLGGSTYWHFPEASLVPVDDLPFNRLGIAPSDHPLFVLLGQLALLAPWGERLVRLNLLSALLGGLAVMLFFHLACYLTGDRWAAGLGAAALAVSHSFWFHSVTTEVYTLHAAFMVGLIWLAVRWAEERRPRDLRTFALLAGLGLANHLMLALLLAATVGYMALAATRGAGAWYRPARYTALLRRVGKRRLVLVAVLFMLGLAPWWIQLVRLVHNIGAPLFGEVIGVFVGTFAGQIGGGAPGNGPVHALLANGARYLAWLLYQFPAGGWLLGLFGMFALSRAEFREQASLPAAAPDAGKMPTLHRVRGRSQRGTAWLLLILFVVHAGFSMNFGVADRFTFHLPSYVIFALFVAYGAAEAGRRWPFSAQGFRIVVLVCLVLAPVALYQVTPRLLSSMGITGRDLGFPPVSNQRMDRLSYFLNPNKQGDDSAARFALSTLRQLAPEAIVFTPRTSDQETYIVLRYYQLAEGRRPDVHLELFFLVTEDEQVPSSLLEMARAQKDCRPLYLASLDPEAYPLAELERAFEIVPEANLYRLRPRQASPDEATCSDVSERWRDLTLRQLLLGLRRE